MMAVSSKRSIIILNEQIGGGGGGGWWWWGGTYFQPCSVSAKVSPAGPRAPAGISSPSGLVPERTRKNNHSICTVCDSIEK